MRVLRRQFLYVSSPSFSTVEPEGTQRRSPRAEVASLVDRFKAYENPARGRETCRTVWAVVPSRVFLHYTCRIEAAVTFIAAIWRPNASSFSSMLRSLLREPFSRCTYFRGAPCFASINRARPGSWWPWRGRSLRNAVSKSHYIRSTTLKSFRSILNIAR